MEYGTRLKAKRKEREITQEQLAEKISSKGFQVTGSYISMIERGYDKRADGDPTRPSRQLVEIAAQVLEDDIDEALMDAGYAPNNRPVAETGLYSGLEKVPPHLRPIAEKQIRAIIDTLVDSDEHDTDYIDT